MTATEATGAAPRRGERGRPRAVVTAGAGVEGRMGDVDAE